MMTISQLNDHANSLDADGMIDEHSLVGAKAAEGDVLGKICGIYKKGTAIFRSGIYLVFSAQKMESANSFFYGCIGWPLSYRRSLKQMT